MDNVKDFFRENEPDFTVYVVEQRFAVGRGSDYFRSFKGKDNLIDSNRKIRHLISRILKWINKRIPSAAELITGCFAVQSPLGISEIVTSLSKLFSVESHQAAGPEVIDPIIIQEGNVLPKYLNQLIHLHRESILRPVIIILLKDNDFDRAKDLLSGCPNKTNIKMIRNSGESILYKVVNTGTDDIETFLDAFASQCYGTCSCTKRDVLLNKDWASNSVIRSFAPELMKIRTNLLGDEKDVIRDELMEVLRNLICYQPNNEYDRKLLNTFHCIARLNNVFCNDSGNGDMQVAYQLAKEVDNELLLAHVYRYSYFMRDRTSQEKAALLKEAQRIFDEHQIADQAIYCTNNRLIRQFNTEKINVREFLNLREEAIYNVPGMVGMSHIYNNAGVAQLMTGNPEDAASSFDAAVDYARLPERSVQKLAIITNKLIAKAYNLEHIDDREFQRTINLIFDNMGTQKLPFLSARYAMNVIAVAFHENPAIAIELLHKNPIAHLVRVALNSNSLGSAQLILQMQYLQSHYSEFTLLDDIRLPRTYSIVTGVQKSYIERNGFNPIFFSTWL